VSERANIAMVCGGCGSLVELILGVPVVDGRARTLGMTDALADHVTASPRCSGALVRMFVGPARAENYAQIAAQMTVGEGRR